MYMCETCHKEFSNGSNLNRHQREVHNALPGPRQFDHDEALYKCLEGCEVSFKCTMDLRIHLYSEHGLENDGEELLFSNYNDFEKWLKAEEKDTNHHYGKICGFRKSQALKSQKIYYNCFRSGRIRNLGPKERKRREKSKGRIKIDSSCTSQIICTVDTDGKCHVVYFKEHYGHGSDIHHLPVSTEQRVAIALKLIEGYSVSDILEDSIKGNTGKSLKRDDMLTKKDIHNVKRKYSIFVNEGRRDANVDTSIDMWLNEHDKDTYNPVLLYKKQGEDSSFYELEEEDVCIIIMNEMQAEVLRSYGSKFICADSIQMPGFFNLELTTLSVIDESKQAFPVAHMFTNRIDLYIYTVFLAELQKIVGTISSEILMSNYVFISPWYEVMGPVKTQLLCTWIVDTSWRDDLAKFGDTETTEWVYNYLRYLQSIEDEKEFKSSLQALLNELASDEKNQLILDYIKSQCSQNTEQWAHCYRKNLDSDTITQLETIHEVTKEIFIEGRRMKRLDRSLHLLQKYILDKTLDGISRLDDVEHISKHKNLIIKRHNIGVNLEYQVESLIDGCYNLKSDSELNFVRRISSKNCCHFNCEACQICIHTYECTCIDFNLTTTICKHIHFVVSHQTKVTKGDSFMDVDEESNSLQQKQIEETIKRHNENKEIIEQMKQLWSQIIGNVETNDLSKEQLEFVMENLRSAQSVSSIEDQSKFEWIDVTPKNGKEKIIRSNENKLGSTTRKKENLNKAQTVSVGINLELQSSGEQESFTELIYISSDSKYDHKY